ncbi:MAG TPA: M15 family metallopeptidase [Acidimicrobiales bacterium]|nr:M15 family metallopeptidase [Acidimicrobiales bacterium]
MRRLVPVILCAALACGADDAPSTAGESFHEAAAAAIDSAPATTRDPPAPTTTVPATSTAPTTTMAPTTTVAKFTSSIGEIDPGRLRYSWRPGCPLSPRDLRLLTLAFWGFDDRVHQGELVVNARHADAIVSVFEQLFAVRFPIERMELVDVYEGNDDRSMVANNTSAFNCREVAGRPGVLSQHALGTAIDVNPLINPWVRSGKVDPPEGAQYADRSKAWKGAIYAGDVVVRAFASIGWGWGGYWPGSYDYQHFAAGG